MYKVFINEKPVFFLQNLEEITLLEGAGMIEFTNSLTLDELLDYHEFNLFTVVIGDEANWNEFKSLFKQIEAAGGLVENSTGLFLFIFRNGKWDLPKGKLEDGENSEIAGVREVEEECGITAPEIESHLMDTYHTYFHKGNWILKKTYWYRMKYAGDELLIPQTEEGIAEVAWISTDQWSKVLANTYGSIQDVLEEHLSNY